MNIAGVILAAGTSSRMAPANKLLLRYKGGTIIEEVLGQLAKSDVDEILIVTGHERKRIEEHLAPLMTARMRFVHNGRYRRGRAESIKRAIDDLSDEVEAVLFLVADKPGVSSELINRAIDRYHSERPGILSVETPTGRGHPILFARELFHELRQLQGDRVGNELVAKHHRQHLRLIDSRPQIDVDTEDDYKQLVDNEDNQPV